MDVASPLVNTRHAIYKLKTFTEVLKKTFMPMFSRIFMGIKKSCVLAEMMYF